MIQYDFRKSLKFVWAIVELEAAKYFFLNVVNFVKNQKTKKPQKLYLFLLAWCFSFSCFGKHIFLGLLNCSFSLALFQLPWESVYLQAKVSQLAVISHFGLGPAFKLSRKIKTLSCSQNSPLRGDPGRTTPTPQPVTEIRPRENPRGRGEASSCV